MNALKTKERRTVGIYLIIPLLLLSIVGSPVFADQPVTVWHIPHPDDETLGMAGGIIGAREAGHRNIVIFYTQGGASSVILTLNGFSSSRLHGRTLRPADEGYTPLSRQTFGAARVAEARAALKVLGVSDEDIHVLDFPDGSLATEDVLSTAWQFAELYPHAAHRGTSLNDPHPDHQNVAKALLRLAQEREKEGFDLDVGLYSVYQYNVPSDRRHKNMIPVAVPDMDRKVAALDEFHVWDPTNGRFAIGAHSVPHLFAAAAHDPYEYMEIIPDDIPARLLRDPRFELVVANHGLALNYKLVANWAVRVSSPYQDVQLNAALLYKTPRVANAVRLYAGTEFHPAGSDMYWVAGAEVRSVVIEYKNNHAGKLLFGLRFPL